MRRSADAAIRLVLDWGPGRKKATGSPSEEVDRCCGKKFGRPGECGIGGRWYGIETDGGKNSWRVGAKPEDEEEEEEEAAS